MMFRAFYFGTVDRINFITLFFSVSLANIGGGFHNRDPGNVTYAISSSISQIMLLVTYYRSFSKHGVGKIFMTPVQANAFIFHNNYAVLP